MLPTNTLMFQCFLRYDAYRCIYSILMNIVIVVFSSRNFNLCSIKTDFSVIFRTLGHHNFWKKWLFWFTADLEWPDFPKMTAWNPRWRPILSLLLGVPCGYQKRPHGIQANARLWTPDVWRLVTGNDMMFYNFFIFWFGFIWHPLASIA